MKWRAIALAILLGGCSLAPSDAVLHELMTSERTWCFMWTSVSVNIRVSGTGLKHGRVRCTLGGMTVTSDPADDDEETIRLERRSR